MISDDMIHGAFDSGRLHRLESETPIVPRAIAEAVCEEVSVWLAQPLPRRWVRELVAHANTVYACNARFRRKVSRRSDSGRDWLWMFMRHWLAARLKAHRQHLFNRLPAFFAGGADLPSRPFASIK